MLGVSPLSPALMHGFALSRLEVAFAYGAAWMVFAVLSAVVALVVAVRGAAIHRECALTRYADDS